jgi:CelD/BcsL family acetyltransferase involved in cellulose biosynthesis
VVVRLLEVDPATDSKWEALVTRERSDVFHSPAWMRVLRRTYALEPQAAIAVDGEAVVAGLPYCAIDDVRGSRLVTLPFSDFCDPVGAEATAWAPISHHLTSFGRPVRLRTLRSRCAVADQAFTAVGEAAWHGLELRPGPEVLWNSIDPSARRAIRRAEREGLSAGLTVDIADLRAFYELHLRTRKAKYRMLAQPFSFFTNLWDEFLAPGDGGLILSRLGDEVVGGILFLNWKDVTYYKFNASHPDYLGMRPNDLALWRGIEWAAGVGLRFIDFGLSDLDQPGLLRYKRKYASEEGTIHTLRSHGASVEAGSPLVGELLTSATRLLTDERVPDSLTEEAGAEWYRYFA